ncbi:hypothetical protein [Streptomyces sp. RFCAC02]|uniref:hypothetical protein n=1 Tax=Streptomyces sp. RFCAC02 TaxID=2499143 RepID=UPI0010227B02|nr:hypothetical protein [Streptomyces sp. RFCAC02]
MHRTIRFALPVAAAASALLLSGCANEDAPFGIEAGDAFDTDIPDDTEIPDMPEFDEDDLGGDTGDLGSDTGGDTGGTGDLGGDTTATSFDGDWYVDLTDTDNSHNLYIGGTTVMFIEDMGSEGDYCNQGTIDSAGNITLGGCTVYGSVEWTDMSATATLNGDGTMSVTWASGLQETYQNQYAY